MKKPVALSPLPDPQWYRDAIIYQLHLKSFFDADNDGVGDFKGLMEKLDYIAELGVTAIWLLPFYPSPRRDDGYDIADYRNVHPDYGTLGDLRRFVAAAHDRGLRVITELVINHTSDQHPWFQKARRSKPGSAARELYVWSDDDKKYAGTRIIFLDTEKSNWTWDEEARAYYWHRFYSHQPDLNFDNPKVMEEVLSIMRFWLDLGIDGLRLDAVPYLVEREGTNNENLPETHAVLRRLREELDRHAPGRMLLAEANQWPEDAQVYFGDGDECHMSFHFPLMPRMYMAIAREDRFPITDIMRQTPAIPENCQWAIFLRNHDELTLEMVTSAERDYLWETYAADKRARLNLGIRRRLAPLLQRDRRRIELMNGLLLSMPGTPVIYYGDEIGMGDNIHLGDRDGVRTPMQWSVDRNGGFSRADPASLVLPPIMDPIYGFQAVNVEAQSRDPHSLLNWMRRMLAVRREHQAFGRGEQRFLYPHNRKVLAYLRVIAGDEEHATILCVGNLSRAAQAVELDLAAYAGRVPVDIIGGSIFPPVGQLPYMLTLPPYGFFWFSLSLQSALPTWHVTAPEPLPEYATLVVRNAMSEIMDAEPRRVLEREVLPVYLPLRRWFASKNEALSSARLAYAVPLTEGRDNRVLFCEIDVEVGGRVERYSLPIGVVQEDCIPLAQQLALTRIRRGPLVGFMTDGFAVDAFTHAMLAKLRDNAAVPIGHGEELRFRGTPRLAETELSQEPTIRRLSAEQSNSSQILDETAVLKVVRRVLDGVHPEAEMTGYLTERGYGNIAPLLGEVVRVNAEGVPSTVALLQGFVRNQGDAWGWALDYLTRTLEDLAARDGEAPEPREAFRDYVQLVRAIGRRLGELHAVLAAPSDLAEFGSTPAETAGTAQWSDAVSRQIDRAVEAVSGTRQWPSSEIEQEAEAFAAAAGGLHEAARRLVAEAVDARVMRVHGDFHLGQVLVVGNDAYIIDFEGEPAKTMEERRAKSCAMRDVAGLLRSLDYAAATVAIGRVATSDALAERRNALATQSRDIATEAFLEAYREVLDAAETPWVPRAHFTDLVDLFLIEKACYEVHYEAANRPDWIGIPLRGLRSLASRLETAR